MRSRRRILLHLAPESLNTPLTYPEAASAVGVSETVVRNWVYRGILKKTGINELGRPTFHWIDVARAERETRAKAGRKYAA